MIQEKFTSIRAEHGPDALAFIASSKTTNEESYLMQKLARAVIGTNNVDNCARYCQNPATTGLQRTVGYGGDSGSIADIEKAGLVFIIGANHVGESHPVLATRVKRSHKFRGQRLIVADHSPKHEMAERADLFIQPNPSTDEVWLMGDGEVHPRPQPGMRRSLSRSMVQSSSMSTLKSLEAVHAGVRGEGDWPARQSTLVTLANEIAAASSGLHPVVGDGRDAALRRIGYVDLNLEPAAVDRQLHAAGNRCVSAARA